MENTVTRNEMQMIPAQAVSAHAPTMQVMSESGAILSMIERAARDPSVDVDKLRQLLDLRQQAESRQAEREFDAAMTEAQSKMGRIRADLENSQTRSRYASYSALDRALRPLYTAAGFALSFNTHDGAAENFVRVGCQVSHKGGHTRRYQIDMPADGKGAKGGDVMTKTHATGSAVSYGMRYLLKMIFNVAVGEDDDDGNTAGAEPITQEQAEMLLASIDEVGADIRKFCEHFKISGVAMLPANKLAQANQMLAAKRARS